jgi:TPR repeat protein
MMCAEATGDGEAAERSLQSLSSLSRFALAPGTDPVWSPPIRVLRPEDIYALLGARGLQPIYDYYAELRPNRRFPIVVVSWDDEAKIERHLAFDFIDAWYTIDRKNEFHGFPHLRNLLAESWVDGQAERKVVVGVDLKAVAAAAQSATPETKVANLRPGAEAGGVQSLKTWMLVCLTSPSATCADGLVDALLPLAEQRHAMAMTYLALAYAEGIGIARDPAAAEGLLKAANERWPNSAMIEYVVMLSYRNGGTLPDSWKGRLADMAEQGNRSAFALPLFQAVAAQGRPEFSREQIDRLSQPALNAEGTGYRLLATYHSKREEPEAAAEWTKRAALAGDAQSHADYGFALLGEGVASNRESADSMLKEAAHGGDARAMRYMSLRSGRAGKWHDAEIWLYPAVLAGNLDATLDLAGIGEWQLPGASTTREQAIEIYRELADNDTAEARRRLAQMAVDGRGLPKDTKQAEAWLLKDAERGDQVSAVLLGGGYLRGEFGEADEIRGAKWMEQALAAGEKSVFVDYGSWFYYYKDSAEARTRAIELWRKGDEAGVQIATNNLAWAWCTSRHADVLDPKRGHELARKLAADPDLPAGFLDTVAACHAAVGDFKSAVDVQSDAIARLSKRGDGTPDDTGGLADRLALYRSGKAYIEPKRE